MSILHLRRGRQGKTRQGHPWIYGRQILKTSPPVKPGVIVSVIDPEGNFLGKGYYNPRSDISVRLLTFTDEVIDRSFFENRIKTAYDKRKGLLSKTNAYRVVFSEADGLPGLIIDAYSDTVVFQIMTFGMERFKDIVVDGIRAVLNPKYIYEKSTSHFRKLEGLKCIQDWIGDKGKELIEIFEGRAKFLVDIEKGHKTGFYLDQRSSRMALGAFSKGKKVLDLFSYTGAFAVDSALSGAASVLAVDIKNEWLELGRRNAELNKVSGIIEFVRDDSFRKLENICNSEETFDIIILDPPSFLKNRKSLTSASKGYKELNTLAMKALNDKGMLATFSCSHNMPNEVFSDVLKKSAVTAGKKIDILKRCHQSEDHPIVRTIPETEYLKGYFLALFSK